MEWITKIIYREEYDTPEQALDNAIKLIDKWCDENNFKYEVLHNCDTGCNRVLHIQTANKLYAYKFIISVCNAETGEFEESKNLFGKKWLTPIYKNVYYAHLDRF